MDAQEIISLIADIVSILAFGTVVVSGIIWLYNLTRKGTIKPNVILKQPTFLQGSSHYISDIDIGFRNLSNRTFYIADISLNINGKRLELFKRQEAHHLNYLTFAPIKVEPYEPINLLCSVFVLCGFEFKGKLDLRVTIGKKIFSYLITPKILP